MVLVQPHNNRATVIDRGTGLEIHIPARRRVFAMVFLPVWLVGWAFGEVSATSELLSGRAGPETAFMLVWLTAWTLGGLAVLTTILWMLRGRQIVRLAHDVLSIRWDLFGLGYNRDYDARQVTDFRVGSEGMAPWQMMRMGSFWGFTGGPIAFDYGSQTVRFGAGLDEAEAKRLAPHIQRLLPHASG